MASTDVGEPAPASTPRTPAGSGGPQRSPGDRGAAKPDRVAIVAAWPAGSRAVPAGNFKKRARALARGILALEVLHGDARTLAAAAVGTHHEELELLRGAGEEHEAREVEVELPTREEPARQVAQEEADGLGRDESTKGRREGITVVKVEFEGLDEVAAEDVHAHGDGQRQADVERVHALDEVGEVPDVVLRERR